MRNEEDWQYTDLSCDSPEIANAVKLYLDEAVAQEEETPSITSYVSKSTLRITYLNVGDRKEWDMQLLGYRDGLTTNSNASSAVLVEEELDNEDKSSAVPSGKVEAHLEVSAAPFNIVYEGGDKGWDEYDFYFDSEEEFQRAKAFLTRCGLAVGVGGYGDRRVSVTPYSSAARARAALLSGVSTQAGAYASALAQHVPDQSSVQHDPESAVSPESSSLDQLSRVAAEKIVSAYYIVTDLMHMAELGDDEFEIETLAAIIRPYIDTFATTPSQQVGGVHWRQLEAMRTAAVFLENLKTYKPSEIEWRAADAAKYLRNEMICAEQEVELVDEEQKSG